MWHDTKLQCAIFLFLLSSFKSIKSFIKFLVPSLHDLIYSSALISFPGKVNKILGQKC